MYRERVELFKELEKRLGRKVILYVTGDRQNFETQIGQDAIDIFINQLNKIGHADKLSLYLYTRGGDVAAAWNIINLLRLYCNDLQVIIPHKAHSSGTLMSIGANSIIMTKQATLGPIDPSLNTPLNPQIPGAPPMHTYPVSVEAVKGYLEFAKNELGIKDDIALSNILIKLSEYVHPLVLGQVYRSRAQIKMLAERLLTNQVSDPDKIKGIISFLCSDSGSHDYTINKREAKDNLKLNVIEPEDPIIYDVIENIYNDFCDEMELNKPFDPMEMINSGNAYRIKGVLIESIYAGSDYFSYEGKMSQVPQGINDQRVGGWKHEYAETNPE